MHFEFLVEGQCEKTTLSIIMPQLLGAYADKHTWLIHKHKGIGKLAGIEQKPSRHDQSLLGQLPAKIQAYAKLKRAGQVIMVLMDLDDQDPESFGAQLAQFKQAYPDLALHFCFAIEELEAWFLGDEAAIASAYPDYDPKALAAYAQDSICGTWEKLAECVDKPLLSLKKRDRKLLDAKRNWSKQIAKHLVVERNRSPSLQAFCDTLAVIKA